MQPIVKQHIEFLPSAIHGKKACIAGTRIRVQDIYVLHELEQLTPHEIVLRYPQLSLADVYAGMTYYWDNQAEILEQIKLGRKVAEDIKKDNTPRLPALTERMRTDADSISS